MAYSIRDDDKCTVTELCKVTNVQAVTIYKQIKARKLPYEHDGIRSYIRFDTLADYRGLLFAKRAKSGVLFIRYAPKVINRFAKSTQNKIDLETIAQLKSDICVRVLKELPQTKKDLEAIAKEEWSKLCSSD